MKSQKVRRDTSMGDRLFVIVMYVVLILLLILMLYPSPGHPPELQFLSD